MKPTCAYPDCGLSLGNNSRRGLCPKHYARMLRQGTIDRFPRTLPAFNSVEERFFSKVEATGFCWLWVGRLNPRGYGTFNPAHAVAVYAHRWSYEHLVGHIPEGLTLDHLCRITNCVNPDHLEPVTPAENNYRKPKKQQCLRGHDLDKGYVRKDGSRMCVKCSTINAAARRRRK